MGFFDFILKKDKRKEIQPIEVPSNELDAWFEDKIKIHFEEINTNCKKVINEIQIILVQFRKNIESLEEATIEEEKVDPRLIQIGLGNKNNLVKKMRSFIDGVEIPNQINHKTAVEFHDLFIRKLEEFNKKSIKSFKRTKILFSSETSQLLKDLKMLNNLNTELISPINEKESLIKDFDKIQKDIEDLKKEISLLKRVEIEHKDQRSHLDKLKEERVEITTNLEKLINSKEWDHQKKLVTEKEEIRNEINKVRKNLFKTLSPLEKSLRKYQNLIKSKNKELDVHVDSLIEALIEEGEIGKLEPIFVNIKESILSGDIELKDKKKEKTLSLINELLETDTLKNSIISHNELVNKLELLDKNIDHNKLKEKEVIQNNVIEIEQRIKEMEEETDKSKKRSALLKKELVNKKNSLEKKIGPVTNQAVKIIE